MYLGTDTSGKQRFCQYVPVKHTLAALFKQSDVRNQYTQSKLRVHTDMTLNDVNDSKYIKENPIFILWFSHTKLVPFTALTTLCRPVDQKPNGK